MDIARVRTAEGGQRAGKGQTAEGEQMNKGEQMDKMEQVERHIKVLDGVRVFAIGLVAWFHFWQQSWLTPGIRLPAWVARLTGMQSIYIDGYVRYGFVFVDMLILLSAFCNFYPYARAILLGEPWPDTKTFYRKRAARILPSYYFSLAAMTILGLVEGSVSLDGLFWKDLAAHITCTAPFFADTYLSRNFSGVLWTLQIEVLYYVLVPWLARLFKKAPVPVCLGLWACGIVSANSIAALGEDSVRVLGNHMLTFAGCYANGMLLAMLYITLKQGVKENVYTRMAADVTAVGCLFALSQMMRRLGAGELQTVQLQQRFGLSLVFSLFLLAVTFAGKGIRLVFANKLMVFLAGISYNFYIWHQYIVVWMKKRRIPFWEGDTPPNITGDRVWMWKYQIGIVLVSLLAAVILTYALEKPAARLLRKKWTKKTEGRATKAA